MAMYPIVRAQLNDFENANSGEEGTDSDFFEVKSIFAVENVILGENIDPFRAHQKGKNLELMG